MPISSIEPQAAERRQMNMFFLVDTSGSMTGRKIGAVNQAIREAMPIIKEISEDNADAAIKVAVLEFSDDCAWMHDVPVDAEKFDWIDLGTHCLTSMGAAFEALNEKLSRKQYMSQNSYQPAIILLSDGAPTDDYKHGLDKLKQNKWFNVAIKVAIAIGDDANKQILSEFTGNSEAVFNADNVYMLKNIIKIASVSASQIGSQSTTSSNSTKQEQVVEEIKKEEKYKLNHPDPISSSEDEDDPFAGF